MFGVSLIINDRRTIDTVTEPTLYGVYNLHDLRVVSTYYVCYLTALQYDLIRASLIRKHRVSCSFGYVRQNPFVFMCGEHSFNLLSTPS